MNIDYESQEIGCAELDRIRGLGSSLALGMKQSGMRNRVPIYRDELTEGNLNSNGKLYAY